MKRFMSVALSVALLAIAGMAQTSMTPALKSVSKQLTSDPIERAEIQGDGLLLTVKNPTTQQTEHYVMRLMSADTAELKMAEMSMPPGMPKPMPWELSRVGPSTVPTR